MDKLIIRSIYTGTKGDGYQRTDQFKMLDNGPNFISSFMSNGRMGDEKRNCVMRIDRANRDKLIKWLLQHQKEYPA